MTPTEPNDPREPTPDDGVADDEQAARALRGLGRVEAPHNFASEVEDKIRRRSAGRFFGRKAFGDRVPFEVLAIIAVVLGLLLFFLLRSSQTGSLRLDPEQDAPQIAPGARDVVPQPEAP